jgi:hypothetical protein
MNKTCVVCNSKFEANSNRSQYCSKECKSHFYFLKNQEKLKQGTESIDYVIDKWNGFATPRIYGAWIRSMHPGKTTEDYLNEFPNAPLACEKDKYATSKNSGLHMKDPKYKKMASEAIKGNKNPNHSSHVSEVVRKSRSPFSKGFKKYKTSEDRDKFLESIDWTSRITSTQLEWWVNQGHSLEDAQKLYKERQATFTLEKCIQKHGKDVGTQIFNERHQKWSANIEEKYKKGEFTRFCQHNWSKTEVDFILTLVNASNLTNEKYYSAANGKQFFRNFKEVGKTFAYDFKYKNKIIEFNGDYWHCNPSLYKSDYFNKSLGCCADERWSYDKFKNKLIENEGYDVLVIWESEWLNYPNETIKKCIDFLND